MSLHSKAKNSNPYSKNSKIIGPLFKNTISLNNSHSLILNPLCNSLSTSPISLKNKAITPISTSPGEKLSSISGPIKSTASHKMTLSLPQKSIKSPLDLSSHNHPHTFQCHPPINKPHIALQSLQPHNHSDSQDDASRLF